MKNLIVDYIPFEISREQINESLKENDGKLVVKGVLQRADAKNQNGRVYPKDILTREAKNYNNNFIEQKRALGELDHPDSSVVNLQNVSHNVTEMHFEGDNLLGTVEILTTPSGNILRELFKNGIKLGISSRGLGSVEAVNEDNGNPVMKVGKDFELIAFDFVSNPSTHGAFMHPLKEGVEKQTQGRTCGSYCKAEDLINKIIRGE
tara:strand:+ start:55 stop:672 length:618 start_codon:yes stop_codon:yes gene_type:complete